MPSDRDQIDIKPRSRDVTDVQVDLESGQMVVTGDADASAVRAAVEEAGYSVAS